MALSVLYESGLQHLADKIQYFADAPDGSWAITNIESFPTQVLCQPRGGFVFVVHE